jgi:predicted dehydrogenase
MLNGFADPLTVALIGAGDRAQNVYRPVVESLQPWVRFVAVCDPVREHADAMAQSLGAPAFYSIFDLVKARPMEAALVVTPVPSHHSISCYLSENGIHNQVETSIASTLLQAQQMVQVARRNNVVFRVAENFFRHPFDRMMQTIEQAGVLGEIKRVTSVYDHTGFHNNSRWIRFYRSHPLAVQAFAHSMPVAPYYERPNRFHTTEDFHCHFFTFPGDRLVVDLAANIKGCLGRMTRPGYTEAAGARGAVVQQTTGQNWLYTSEVRYCSDQALKAGGRADHICPIVEVYEDGRWVSSYVDLPTGRIEYVSPLRSQATRPEIYGHFWGATIMGHIIDFARAIRDGAPSEYTDDDAVMAMMMESGCWESARRGGVRIDLPLAGELEADAIILAAQRKQFGIDPLDVEGMLRISYPKP